MDECKFKPGDKVVIHAVVVGETKGSDFIVVKTKSEQYLSVFADDADNPPDIPPGSGGGGD